MDKRKRGKRDRERGKGKEGKGDKLFEASIARAVGLLRLDLPNKDLAVFAVHLQVCGW